MIVEIANGTLQQSNAVLEMPKASVTVSAEESSVLACLVAMVVMCMTTIRLEFHHADSTFATLLPQSFLVLLYRYTMLVLYIGSTLS